MIRGSLDCAEMASGIQNCLRTDGRLNPTVPLQRTPPPKSFTEPGQSAGKHAVHQPNRHFASIAFGLILAIGIIMRVWDYGLLPPGLNPDEASAGVEALNLHRFGFDRNGVSFPVKFISWGSGQDVLYTYLLIPFVAVFGLGPTVVRLPMLASGILALPLTYLAAMRLFNVRVGLTAMFMLAVSPWHILLSRWALDANLLPFVFLAGFAALLHADKNGWWFSAACLLFGLCLYAYGTAYAVIPIFLVSIVALGEFRGRLSKAQWSVGASLLAVTGLPILLLILINALDWPSIALGPITVPRFPAPVRWISTTLLGSGGPLATLLTNLWIGIRLLALETDGLINNVVEPYGYFYRIGLPLAGIGLYLASTDQRTAKRFGVRMLYAWLGAAFAVVLFQPTNINRLNIIFIPMLILGAIPLGRILDRHPRFAVALAIGCAVALGAFSMQYHGPAYRAQIDSEYQKGILPAIEFARDATTGGVCITDKINMPYIYALFSERTPPRDFLASVKYDDDADPFRRVTSFGRYAFGVRNCSLDQETAYVLRADEVAPRLGRRYSFEYFDQFVVYYAETREP